MKLFRTSKMNKRNFSSLALIGASLFIFNASSAEIKVNMLNKGSDGETMVFEPAFVKANVGDKVTFVIVDKGHSVQSFKGEDSRPKGAKEFKGGMNKGVTYEVKEEGVHVFICQPHYAMGMIGMIVAGKATNLDTIKNLKISGAKAKTRFQNLLGQIK